ncbi:hypothetical protein ONZ51_g238 [Trametes cubensis]|uniref:Uncharacterized protein n=1 Tax=Trametes cubensis TaxID=1111947 RepID=A0AAD7U4M1_9APHY|nr:hypothetical protein ONZ51_g238 [Trametes cubensis]
MALNNWYDAASESSSTDNNAAPGSIPKPPFQSSKTPDRSSTNAGDAQSQSNPVPQTSSPSSPTGVPSQQTTSLPNHEVQTGSSASSAATAGGSSGLLPVALTVASGQPSSQSTTAYVSGTSQSPQSNSSSSNTHGNARPSASLPPTSDSMRSAGGSSNHVGAIIAGVVGGVVLLTVAVWLALWVIRRRRFDHARRVLGTSGLLDRCRLSEGEPLNDKLREKKGQENDIATEPEIEPRSPYVQPPPEEASIPAPYIMKLYDPDDPSTYPPPLSEILRHIPVGVPEHPSGAPEVCEILMLRLAGASGTARLARACFLVLNLIASIPPKEAAILAGEAVSGSCLDSSYSWDDETFDVQAAEQEAGGIQPSGSSSISRTVTPSVQSHSPQSSSTSRTSAQTSQSTSSTQPPDPSIAQESSGSLPNTGVQTAQTSQSTAQFGQSSGSRPSGALTGTSQPPFGSTNSQPSQETQADAPTSPPHTSSSPSPTQPTNVRSSSRSSVIGGVVGSAITVVILATVGFLARRWRHRGGSRFKLFNSGSPGHEPLNIGPEEKGNVEEGEDVRVDPRFATQPMAEEPFIPASYTMKVYDPDDPSTYPPRLTELQGNLPARTPANPSGAPEIYEVR